MKLRIWNLKLQPKLLLGLVVMAAVLAAALTPTISRMYRSQMVFLPNFSSLCEPDYGIRAGESLN